MSKKKLIKPILTILIIIPGFAGLWYYYGWQMPLFLMLVLWGNNIERSNDDL